MSTNNIDNKILTEKKIKSVSKTTNPKRIAIYVIYDKDGILGDFRKYYLTELRKVVDHIVAVVSGTITPDSRKELETLSDEILVRENKGLLAGSWVDGIKHIGWNTLDNYDELLMLNDSFFGPFFPLKDMFDHMEESDSDFYGAMRNFEEKDYTIMGGRRPKHGFFRGSICYFYIIKSRLLHSPEFKKYWSELPEINSDWDTYFFAEIDFYDYVVDAGFKVDSYQSEKLKGYFSDNLTHNMRKLIEGDKIPFARIRPFCTDLKDQSMQINYGKDPREALEYIDKNTDYDTKMIWDFILRTKNITDIYNQMQLEYVIPKHSIEKTFTYGDRIAVILHIFYEDCVEDVAEYCKNFPKNTDFFITTTTDKTEKKIHEVFESLKLSYKCKQRPNVGVAMSSLWVTYADVITSGNYEYMCYFHDKKSPYSHHAIQGEQFAKRCYENLYGTPEIIKNIINLFEENPRMGMIGPPLLYHGEYYSVAIRSWLGNYQNTVDLAQKLDIKSNISPYTTPVAPYGDMFWFRSKALSKAVGKGLTYDDFDVPYKPDFTFMHAIERIYAFAVQDAGYYYADVINTDDARSDLINYQYMIHQFSSIMMQNGCDPRNFYLATEIVHTAKPSIFASERSERKAAIKARTPKWLWNFMRKIYHFFGGGRKKN